MADFEYGVTCIVADLKGSKDVNLTFVMRRSQYNVVYKERKSRYDDRNFTKLLTVGDALKASAWKVPSGPPGSNKFSWYVTDVWTPNIAGMFKKRLPEPTFSIACKVIHKLGKAYLVCEVGKFFPRDVIVLPRSAIQCIVENTQPGIGDYLLVSILLMWGQQGNEQRPKLIPIWAHWDKSNGTESSIAHLNAIESGPENENLLIQDQIPCMWGVVQNVYKKSFLVYVPCIGSSVTVLFTVVHQYNSSMLIVEGDWVQLWLVPQASGKAVNHLAEVNVWSCSVCCWLGSRAKKTYEMLLLQRLTSRYHKNGALIPPEPKPTSNDVSKTAPSATQAPNNDIVGKGKVTLVKDKSALMKCGDKSCKKDHVIHLGMFTVYGIKVCHVKKCRMKDIVEQGSEIHYRMNASTKNVRTVWIGPEVVAFRNFNFMPQLVTWMKKRNLDGEIIREMVKQMTDLADAQSSAKSTDPKAASQANVNINAPLEKKVETDLNETIDTVLPYSTGIDQSKGEHDSSSILEKEEKSVDEAMPLELPENGKVQQPLNDVLDFDFRYSKEEEEELERAWWSDDSDEESDVELRPVLKITPLDESPKPQVPVEDSQVSGTNVGASLSTNEESSLDNGGKNGSSKFHSIGNDINVEEEFASNGSGGISDSKSNVSIPNLMAEPVNGNGTPHGPNNMEVTKPKNENTKKASCLLVMTELTKFLLMKGKVSSVAEAGELSANFVSHLESVVDESNLPSTTSQSVGTQTEITGPIKSEL